MKTKALKYHQGIKPGKISITTHKPLETQQDLALAYSPGVAEPVKEIIKNPQNSYKYTSKGNLIAVISDGSAVLGLGNVGALAAKPVMEGKSALFKKFADIDVFDIEIATQDVDEFITTVKNIAPTFGGINLEDISAPRCFEIEERLIKDLDIPVFHDDQHGTAIVISAGLFNSMQIQGKDIASVKLVCLGAGSAGIATLNLLCSMGLKKENITLIDKEGVIHHKLKNINQQKLKYATKTKKRTLADAMHNADVFIGVAAANLVTKTMISSMAKNAIIFALSNPTPEIMPEDVFNVRKDVIMATGRSDYPNQINNVLCFPFIFKGALKANAKIINTPMKIAASRALQAITKQPVPSKIKSMYNDKTLAFGKNYIIPKPFDPRLMDVVTEAVYQAAISSKVTRT